MTVLNANLKGNTYYIEFTELFLNKLEEQQTITFKSVIFMLERSEEEILGAAVGESFFIVGDEYSVEGVRTEGKIELIRFIPSSHVL
ncbi:hypothetical protein [Paenibacillus polymyxa]|uniref:Uncharacterized protein n=1 Tax=Paenibacillus polymyxa (strain SC2) TaxID=886882 RepID=E3EJS3_PAEPS|nr:hypothetical protein [Paenibacillus polymyxa]ADO59671.1 hypothetical protein PPSC2_26755 [Paenibacillus polymyxa SC2]WPQ59502.1 hypothetical protein SKN87_27965 [Paenibacillus polymyxa]